MTHLYIKLVVLAPLIKESREDVSDMFHLKQFE